MVLRQQQPCPTMRFIPAIFLHLLAFWLQLSRVLAMTKYEALRELGLQSDASAADIKKAYRKWSLATHPDKGGSSEDFVRVAEAYQVLTDNNGGNTTGGSAADTMSDEEKMKMAETLFFELFDEFLVHTDATADKLVDWILDQFDNASDMKKVKEERRRTAYRYQPGSSKRKKTANDQTPRKDSTLQSIFRWFVRKAIRFIQSFLENDKTVIIVNGQKMTGADLRRFREKAQQRIKKKKDEL